MEINILTAEEARKIFREELAAHDKELLEAVQLPLGEVKERLGKSAATLWRWSKTGYLPRHKRGGRGVWYWESDVRIVEHDLGIKNEGGDTDE